MKEKIYIETTVVSFYTAIMSGDLVKAARQKMTHEWWEKVLPKYEGVVSPYVFKEIIGGDPAAAAKRIAAIKQFGVLTATDFTDELAGEYFRKSKIPRKSLLDCYHLAIAATNGVDFVVSWNFKHIANPAIRKIVREINEHHNLISPEISSPEEMLGGV